MDSSGLMPGFNHFFSEVLPTLVEDYQPRQGQIELALKIRDVLKNGSIGLFEAGTGTGKTLSYLVPVLLGDGPFIISTGTRNLQDQLFLKDLPMLGPLFPDKRVALLKGRSNYLCPRRLNRHLETKQQSSELADDLISIRRWWSQTSTGDLGEVVDLDEKPGLAPLVTSTRDNCLASRCPDFAGCPLYLARQKAVEADVIVANHHLLFADLAQREDHMRGLLPRVKGIILDEAHQVPDTARLFFGQRMSSAQMIELNRDLQTELGMLGRDDPETARLGNQFSDAVHRLIDQVLQSDEPIFSAWLTKSGRHAIDGVDESLATLALRLQQVADRSEGLAQCARRAVACLDQFALLSEEIAVDDEQAVSSSHADSHAYAHWLERGNNRFVLHLSPISIAADMSEMIRDSDAAWVFTSATLTVDQSFRHFQMELGLEAESTDRFDSPFDFRSAVKAWVPPGLPLPGSDNHTLKLMESIVPLLQVNPGRTFVLFTSHRALRLAHEILAGALAGSRPLLVQGHGGRSRLIEEFRVRPRAVLLATQSFWEGVDVSGADLRLLIIDKLPFPNPSDPLVVAQSIRIQQAGGNSFAEFALPRAIISLKQGFGRLVRKESDSGVFVLGDGRILQRPYGKIVRDNLPDMNWQASLDDLKAWLSTTRSST